MMKFLQAAVYCGLVFVFHELAPETSMFAALLLALAVTALIFAIPLNVHMWLLSRKARRHQRLQDHRAPD